MILYPYKAGSESSKALAEALGIKRVSHKNSKFKGSQDKVVINWGASTVPEEVSKCTVLNKPEAVKLAANKLSFFQTVMGAEQYRGEQAIILHDGGDEVKVKVTHMYVEGIVIGDKCPADPSYTLVYLPPKPLARVPEFTTDKRTAVDWLARGNVVIARTILNGNSGAGIVLIEPKELLDMGYNLVDAPLYVKYVPKKQEYRVHVFQGQVVDVQRKARRQDVADDQINWRIRNHDNGFIFARGEALGDVPEDVLEQAVKAAAGVGLDFGAVDVIFNDKQQQAYVLEINTAPGLSGSTLDGYVNRFKELM